MATVEFRNVTVTTWEDGGEGKKVASNIKTSFSTNVMSAIVTLQGFNAAYSTDYNVKNVGTSISNVSYNGSDVYFDAEVQLYDTAHNPANASLQAVLIVNNTLGLVIVRPILSSQIPNLILGLFNLIVVIAK